MTILRFVAAQDVGRAIHPSYVEGQIQGGVVQGIGWALNEEYIYDAQGPARECRASSTIACPVASDLPMIEPVLVEVPNPAHPYGAKGVAEVNICPPMAAIANAIERAIGRRLTELPMSPPKVLRRDRRQGRRRLSDDDRAGRFTTGFSRRYTGGVTEFEVEAKTLRGVIKAMDRSSPASAGTLEEETTVAIDGELHEIGFLRPIRPAPRSSSFRRSRGDSTDRST